MKFLVNFLKTLLFLTLFLVNCYIANRLFHHIYPVRVYHSNHPLPSHQTRAEPLRVGAYNIAHGRGGQLGLNNWTGRSKSQVLQHLDAIVEQIHQADVDILVLNEVDFSSVWSQRINQAEYIMHKAGFSHRMEQTNMRFGIPFFNFHFGNAVLSKYPITHAEPLNFPALSALEAVVAGDHDGSYCTIDTPKGTLGVFPIHLEYRDEHIRVQSMDVMRQFARELTVPILAVGDFNSAPSGTPKSSTNAQGKNTMDVLLGEAHFDSYRAQPITSEHFTFPSQHPDRIIDWIIGKKIKVFSAPDTISSNLSDHLMITTQIDF